MKHLLFVLITIPVLLILIACTQTTMDENQEATGDNTISFEEVVSADVSCAEIAAEIISKFEINAEDFDVFDHSVEEARLDQGTISYFYGGQDITEEPDFSHVTDYYILVPVTTAATEIGIFKLDDTADAGAMMEYFKNRSAARASTFAPYNEAESAKARDALISSDGEYVWYIMTDKNLEIEGTIKEMI